MKKIAVIIVGHGSRRPGFQKAMRRVADALKKKSDYFGVCCAYLEVASPSIPQAIESFAKKGADEIKVLPYFLLTGNHVEEDIPLIVKQTQKKIGSKAKITLCPYLGFDEKIVSLIEKRLKGRA